jgi:uncharacterized protein (TIGR02145 family)
MKTIHLFLLPALAFIACAGLQAQVTIGGLTEPKAGAVLDLNSTVKGGLLLSNVNLTDLREIPDSFVGVNESDATLKARFKGAIIYNTNATIGAGIYVWTGEKWWPIDCMADPATPGAITLSATTVDLDATFTASISPVPGAERYVWDLPEGLTGSSSTTSITITVADAHIYAVGSIKVAAVDKCGTGSFSASSDIVTVTGIITDLQGNEYTIAYFGATADWWMTQNLQSTKTVQGADITAGYSSTATDKRIDYPGSSTDMAARKAALEANSNKLLKDYGLLYSWEAAQVVCPTGWHLPSDSEWSQLEQEIATNPQYYSNQTEAYAGAGTYNFSSTSYSWRPGTGGTDETYWGRQMKSTTSVNGTNPLGTSKSRKYSGFDILLVGFFRTGENPPGPSIYGYGYDAAFWSSSTKSYPTTDGVGRDLYSGNTGVSQYASPKTALMSVRCKKNN